MEIKELRNNLEIFKRKGAIDSSSYTVMINNLKGLEIELESVEKEALVHKENSDRLFKEKLLLVQEKEALSAQVSRLSQEKLELESRISVLQRTRPAFSPANLVSTFKASLDEMDRGLKTAPSRTKYNVSSMNVTLKTNLALEGGELRFQMPKADDIVPPENLSTIEFSLKAVPEKPDLASYKEVPYLVGLSKEEAEGKLLEAGFRLGEVLEKDSSAPEGTVISQIPSARAVAEPGASVDLIISRILSVKVPSLLGLDLESAKKVIEKSGFKLGGVRAQPSDTKPGIVLAQSLKPGSEAEAGTEIFLMVSAEMKKDVPEKILSDKAGNISRGSLVRTPAEVSAKVSTEIPAKISTDTSAKVSTDTSAKVSTDTSAKVSTETPAATSGPAPEPKPSEVPKPETPETPKAEVKTVPRVTGIPLEKAADVLESAGIKVGKVSEIASRASPGMVLSQSPKAGSVANPLIPVDLAVSKEIPETKPPVVVKPVVSEPLKPEAKTVPRVTGIPLEKAAAVLEREGIKVGKVSEIASRAPQGTVLSQSPRAGSIANPLIPVDLVVSKGGSDLNLRFSSRLVR